MHGHRNGGPPHWLPDPASLGYHAQKVVLAELVIDPPDEGSPLAYLRERLPLPPEAIEPALGALQVDGPRRAPRQPRARERSGALLRVPVAGDVVSDPTGSVLDLLLEHHPALLSVEEVIREMTAGADTFGARDHIEVALRRLVETGLAHRLGSFVFASHAAVRFYKLS